MTTPAGWYPDPGEPTNQRYWDGQQWTERTAPLAPGARMSDFGRSEEDVARAVAAVLWRHAKTTPLAATSRCSGGETRCAFSMDADAFQRHQARAVVDEVFVPELELLVEQTQLAARTVERIAETLGMAAQPHEANTGREQRWGSSSLVGWVVTIVVGAVFLTVLLRAWFA